MANITRFDPFAELSRFNPLGDDFLRNFMHRLPAMPAEPQMRLDVAEDDKSYTVKAEIPGVKKEDIKVSVDGNQVSISAEVKQEKEQKEGTKVIRSERYFGSVARSFSLACDVDEDGAQAKYDNGVLVVTLPKKGGAGAKRVNVS